MFAHSRLSVICVLAGLIIALPITGPANADERVNEAIRRQQRDQCERQGGRYDYPKCYLPPERSESDESDDAPVGHIFQRNYGSCAYDLLIAYVPKGSTGYVVDGWWDITPSSWGSLKDDKNRYLVHDDKYPLYFHGQKKNGQKFRGDRHDRSFEFSGRSYPFTRVANGLYQGRYWLEINCS